jgi:hypothetical protein
LNPQQSDLPDRVTHPAHFRAAAQSARFDALLTA